eukprot:TRINITY_DN3507_c0_g1_i1.p1 TRINITY_DN3507_c0_g1~~TRINITY_DN3507_c0_g1_i1.p1  ORF type:complete len:162 (+),score=34.66 TRINITY_DN3507_c0_g1_i1:89-574(+)
MGPSTRVLGILVFIGTAHCDQSAYPQTNVVAPLTQEYADTGLVDNSAYYNTADYSQGAYTDYGQYSENDRTAELIETAITIPMAITAFFAALLGGILAPIVSDGMRSLSEFEFELPDFPEIKRKTNKGREFDELAKPISSLFKVAAGKLITNAIERLQKSQ